MALDQRIVLSSDFRFVHEPLGTTSSASASRFVGREPELGELASRILLSEGGAFLITGYRGVGKSSFVNQVILALRRDLTAAGALIGPTDLVDVYLNFARPVSAVELMFHVLRSLRHRLQELGLLDQLPADLRSDLDLACQRTSLNITSTAATQAERSLQLAELPFTSIKLPIQAGFTRTSEQSQGLQYLAYDDKAAEYDLVRLARRLTEGYVPAGRRRRWPLRWLRPATGSRVKLKVVFIFDELDKLDEGRDASGGSALDAILGNLKTLFTTSGITFLFVAGKGLQDRLLEDVGRGDSIYESVFTYARYLPALWQHAEAICDPLVAADLDAPAGDAAETYSAFKKFLAFKGRGIPRRILRGFNEQVRWDGRRAALVFSAADRRRCRFYAGIYDVLMGGEAGLLGRQRTEQTSEQQDRQRLALYYLTDWILQRGSSDFSAEDVVSASRRLSQVIAPIEESAAALVKALIDTLLEHQYLEEVPAEARAQVVAEGGRPAAPMTHYRVARRRLLEMGGEASAYEMESEALQREDEGIPVDRFRVLRTLGRGGMSDVLLATDKRTGGVVAIKRLRLDVDMPELRHRFEREARILRELHHPGIVELLEVSLHSTPPFLVMEHVDGLTLSELIRKRAFRDLGDVLTIARQIAVTLDYLHKRGIVWRDAKPANVVLTTEGRVVLLDFGIARHAGSSEQAEDAADQLTQHGSVVGTVGYMSPEMLRGETPDARSDLYGLGVMLYEMLVGRPPFEGTGPTVYLRVLQEPPPAPSLGATVPPDVDRLTLRLLATHPDQRFQTARAFLDACPPLPPVDLADLGREAKAREARDAHRESQTTRFVSPTVMVTTLRDADVAGGDSATVMVRVPPPPETAGTVLHPTAYPPVMASGELPAAHDVSRPVAPRWGTADADLPPPPVPAPPVPAPPVPSPVRTGGTAARLLLPDGRDVPLSAERVTIGRSQENTIVINEMRASRFQAALLRQGEGYALDDLNSVNGTLLNGERVSGRTILNGGDQIAIGGTVLTYLA